jgi:outer membrane cobalamin receptor
LLNGVAMADSQEVDLFGLSVAELMQVEIVSLSKESISQSPGIVSSYTSEELKNMGFTSLGDFLSFVPGVEVNKSIVGINVVHIRGISDSFNQKVLLLLDGVPYWEPSNGDIPLHGIPLIAIEKIEVIRGPGSVVHGTNASAGVINVITKKNTTNMVEVTTSSNNLSNYSAMVGLNLEDGNNLILSVEKQVDDGYDVEVQNALDFNPATFQVTHDEDGSIVRSINKEIIHLKLKYNNINAFVQNHMSEETSGASGSIKSKRHYQKYGTMAHVDYSNSLSENNELTIFSDWNKFYHELPTDEIQALLGFDDDGTFKYDDNGNKNTRWRSGLKFSSKLTSDWSLLAGIESEDRSTGTYKFFDGNNGANASSEPFGSPIEEDGSVTQSEEEKASENSVYAQLDYSAGYLRVVGGVRYITNSASGEHLAPRVSIVRSLDENSTIKLLHAEGFNSPTFRQSANIDQIGNFVETDVGPEIITTTDLAYSYTDHETHFVANIFKLILTDGISKGNSGSFENVSELERNGFELDFRIKSANWKYLVGGSYLMEGNTEADDDPAAYYLSQYTLKPGFMYQHQDHVFGGSVSHVSNAGDAPASNLVNLNYKWSKNNWTTNLKVTNLLDDKIFQADVRSLNPVLVQSEEIKKLYLSVGYNF